MKKTLLDRLLLHLTKQLHRNIHVSGILLMDESGILAASGNSPPGEKTTDYAFGKFKLRIGKAASEITRDEKNAIHGARDLIGVLTNGLREPGDAYLSAGEPILGKIRASHFIHSLLLLIKDYQSRAGATAYYEEIMSLSNRILEATDLDSALEIIIKTTSEAVASSGSSIILIEPRDGSMYFHSISNQNKKEIWNMKIPEGKGIAGSVARTGKPEIIKDVARDSRFYDRVDRTLGQTTKDIIAAPIIARDRIVGVLESINSTRSDGFGAEDLEFLTTIARHTGLLLENARSRQSLMNSRNELTQLSKEMTTLHDLIGFVTSIESKEKLRSGVLRKMIQHLHFEKGAILIPDETGSNLVMDYALNYREGEIREESHNIVYRNIKDILIWMEKNNEPYMFTGMADRAGLSGIARRFYEENPEMIEEGPGFWMPIRSNESSGISYVISMNYPPVHGDQFSGDVPFFQSMMELISSTEKQFAYESKRSDGGLDAPSAPSPADSHNQPVHLNQKLTEQSVILYFRNHSSDSGDESIKMIQEKIQLSGSGKMMVQSQNEAGILFRTGSREGPFQAFSTANDIAEWMTATFPGAIWNLALHEGLLETENNPGEFDPLRIQLVHCARWMCEVAGYYKIPVVFSQSFLREMSDRPPACRRIELLEDCNSSGPISLYESLTDQSDFIPFLPQWEMAVSEYQKGNFKRAEVLFRGIHISMPEDIPARIYTERCKNYNQSSVPSNWSAVLRWTEKPPVEEWAPGEEI